ncbi:MAG TPA: hypothetical protein VLV83_01655, partial [Acidobacteriota bacterium]|nr:hypothetical protein [Acidobacteriota bacterium]
MIIRSFLWLIHLPLQVLLLIVFAAAALLQSLLSPFRRLLSRRTADTPAVRADACSIVMLNWNGRTLMEEGLPPLIKAVEAAGGGHEVLVVD